MPLTGGENFAGYRIVRLLGSGGMGEVYLVEHPRLPRRDALKVLPADVSADPDYRARFEREADLASKLWHPHIVSVHDRGEYNGQLWISMDYVDGLDAARLLASRLPGGIPTDQVLRIVTGVASALDYAHKRGLLHRDVKPANIMLTHFGDGDNDEQRVLLADFGIARNIDDISGLTSTNMTVGTVAYSAPEQLMGEELDGRADQYALAATAYHLLTGAQLFPLSNPAVVISRHLNSPPPAVADMRPDLAALDRALAIALAKNPQDRFSKCTDFARVLASARDQIGDSQQHREPPFSHGARFTASSEGLVVDDGASPPKPPPGSQAGPSAASGEDPTMPADAASPPPRHVKSSRPHRRKLFGFKYTVAALAVILLAGVIAVAWHPWNKGQSTAMTTTSSHPPPAVFSNSAAAPPPPPPPTFPANAIDTVLLGPAEIASVTGSTGPPLEISRPADYPIWSRLKPASCSNVMFNAERVTDPNTGVVAERDGKFARSSVSEGQGPANVEESVLTFASVDEAKAVFNSSQAQWRSCASNEITVGYGEDSWTYKFGDVQFHGDVSSVSMAAGSIAEVGSRACQTAIGLRANVVVETWTCLWANFPYFPATPADPNAAGDYAVQLVTAMLDKVKV